jgi:hypothetical protein
MKKRAGKNSEYGISTKLAGCRRQRLSTPTRADGAVRALSGCELAQPGGLNGGKERFA